MLLALYRSMLVLTFVTVKKIANGRLLLNIVVLFLPTCKSLPLYEKNSCYVVFTKPYEAIKYKFNCLVLICINDKPMNSENEF